MFEQTFLKGTGKTRRAWSVMAGFVGQVAGISVVALLPLVFFDGMPNLRPPSLPLVAPRGPSPPPETNGTVVELVPVPHSLNPRVLRVPPRIPMGVIRVVDGPAPVATGPTGPCLGTCIPGFPDGVPNAVLPPGQDVVQPPPVARPRRPVEPAVTRDAPVIVRVPTTVQEAKLIHRVTPVYPPLAVRTRTSGVVLLAAIIGTDGRIRDLRLVGGANPLLVPAAIEAVRQWVYRPTLLSGNPVEVSTEITVIFRFTGN
jgi:protein TonB